MIILRQKLYTRADNEAWLEFLRATNNFRTIPKGYTGMDAKDIIRFNNAAHIIDTKGINSLDPNEAKYLLGKMGLHKAAGNYDHMLKKYVNTDPEVLERFRRIQEAKNKAILDPILEKANNDIKNSGVKTRLENIDKVIDRLNGESWENIKKNNLSKGMNLDKRLAKLHKLREKYNPINFIDSEQINNLNNSMHGENFRDLLISRFKSSNVLSDKIENDLSRQTDNNKFTNIIQNVVFKKPGIHRVRSSTSKVPRSAYLYKSSNPEAGGIIEVRSRDPFTLLHEFGHHSFIAQHPETDDSGKWGELSHELGASAHAMAQAKNLGFSPEQMKLGRKELEQAGNTYFTKAVRNGLDNMRGKFNLINKGWISNYTKNNPKFPYLNNVIN